MNDDGKKRLCALACIIVTIFDALCLGGLVCFLTWLIIAEHSVRQIVAFCITINFSLLLCFLTTILAFSLFYKDIKKSNKSNIEIETDNYNKELLEKLKIEYENANNQKSKGDK